MADPVAHGEWGEEWQHEIRTGANSPDSERLPGVSIASVKPEPFRYVDEAHHADRGVHEEATYLCTGGARPRLEEVVHESPGHLEVREGVVEAPLYPVGKDPVPCFAEGLHDEPIEHAVVEGEG